MGIQGLLPLLKDIQTEIHVSDLKGLVVGIDAYCWLHRGAYSCSQELCQGIPTDKHIRYFEARLNLLRNHGVVPFVVFDGGPLPMKRGQEKIRLLRRQENAQKAFSALKEGNSVEARKHFAKAVDITPEIARQAIDLIKQLNINYIVAPYEADAQLAYLYKKRLIDVVISEDSDLLVYGINRVVFKLDHLGNGMQLCLEDLAKTRSLNFCGWNHFMFRMMCVLSGCDYLESFSGMGLKKAYALVNSSKTFEKVIRRIRLDGIFEITIDYERNLARALLMYQAQRIYDPESRIMTSLEDVPGIFCGFRFEDLGFLGEMLDPKTSENIARGILHPISLEPFVVSVKEPVVVSRLTHSTDLIHANTDLCAKSKVQSKYFSTSAIPEKEDELPRTKGETLLSFKSTLLGTKNFPSLLRTTESLFKSESRKDNEFSKISSTQSVSNCNYRRETLDKENRQGYNSHLIANARLSLSRTSIFNDTIRKAIDLDEITKSMSCRIQCLDSLKKKNYSLLKRSQSIQPEICAVSQRKSKMLRSSISISSLIQSSTSNIFDFFIFFCCLR